ncbi:helicase [Flavobacterium limnosediminis JC2902]|uniref:Helicase n=1 Tax=Flavobacterium limnosediminis JC2902 TaxID=1341181 RepID=V6SKF6_9FLAO|nr:DEAD/DEAH box helicase family protein [Flavobacterium limnosediminis]ESU27086.1 helicase [Flavobacterium limnosediminis JC2902]
MIDITLPELNINCWQQVGNKNIVKQLLEKELKSQFNFISSHRSHSVIESKGIEYCLSCNLESFPNDFEYVILTDKKATQQKLETNQIKFKSWIKHPKLKEYTNEEIIESWDNDFNYIEENIIKGTNGLREPQIAGLYSILSHLKIAESIGTVVMPTGTGKTETMLGTLVANKCNKLLITVPSDALRNQIANKFYKLGLLKQFGIVGEKSLFPKVGILFQNFSDANDLVDFIDNCNVLVTTMNLLANNSNENLLLFSEKFSNIFIDEAHHIEASSWKKVRDFFDDTKILQFTATPFRNDRKRLEGKVIFNFSLKKAQEQGYFKPINFIPIREYDFKKGDKLIAEKAIEKLQEDLNNGYNHILMARCENKTRAEEIFEIYKEYKDYNPVLIHSSVTGKKDILSSIINGEHRIIVAVNMLGEGFDLPQLKIAVFHDIRKSLPITLQFAGRFTRTSTDDELGNATFIANLADINTENELSELYAQDSDWNLLLSTLSSDEIQEQVDFNEFINGFQHLDNSKIPFQNIKFALSTVVYKNMSQDKSFNFSKFKNGFQNYDDLEYKFSDYNPNENTLVVITASKTEVEWVNYKEVFGLNWELTILYYNTDLNLLFIHSSDKSGFYSELANSILNDSAEMINQLNVFKSFYDVKRVSLQNVGLKEFLNRKIRFTMRVGTDIEEALSIAEQQRGQKAFVFGSGYEQGNKITLGCSYKGRIWSYLRSDLKGFISWCKNIGVKLIDDAIDPNQVLRQTLIPEIISEIPNIFPTHIDWDDNFYDYPESKISFRINNQEFGLSNCSINIINPNDQRKIEFEIKTPTSSVKYSKELFIDTNEDGSNFPNFKINKIDQVKSEIIIGNKTNDFTEYLNSNPPIIWFADGSALQGNEYVELKHIIQPYLTERLIAWDWTGIDLSKEAQGVNPFKIDSIQYRVIQRLLQDDFDIIYDDDYSGEIADVITIKETDREINIQFYHLKFAKDGNINTRVDNFYEVCGQAQKSIHWKHKRGTEFFEHLLRRKLKIRNGSDRSRLEKGTAQDLERLLTIAKNRKPMNFEIFIVQPSLSKQNVSESIMTLLGVTDNYLKEVGNINLKVIVSK